MGFILFLVATLLYIPLTILNVIAVCVKHVKVRGFWNVVNGYFKQTAVDIDMFGNHQFRTLLNLCLIADGGYEFGVPTETISSALGKNKKAGTLSKIGKCIAGILDTLDENHCINSINDKKK